MRWVAEPVFSITGNYRFRENLSNVFHETSREGSKNIEEFEKKMLKMKSDTIEGVILHYFPLGFH